MGNDRSLAETQEYPPWGKIARADPEFQYLNAFFQKKEVKYKKSTKERVSRTKKPGKR